MYFTFYSVTAYVMKFYYIFFNVITKHAKWYVIIVSSLITHGHHDKIIFPIFFSISACHKIFYSVIIHMENYTKTKT